MTWHQEHTLRAADGVPISAVHVARGDTGHRAGDARDLCFVVVHGFTGTWRQDRVQRVVARLSAFGGVIAIDLRGHGRSGGRSTVGEDEVLDVAAAIGWAREMGYERVVTVGFSLGGAVVLREAGLARAGGPEGDRLRGAEVDAVVSVSAPAFWYYRGTRVMRLVHHLVETRTGRLVMRASGTRIASKEWTEPLPTTPREAAALLGPVPLLIVHGDVDRYFPLEHPREIHAAASATGVRAEMWLIDGFGHAEASIPPETLDRIGNWARESVAGASG